MAMAEEEENFIRIFRLVSGVAPRAVRDKFDKYFPPVCLTTILQNEEPKLKSFVQRKWLTTTQMAVLFPTTGVTSSSNYDVTLMICLLSNLTSIRPPVKGFDVLPPGSDTSEGADLSRVKYYRNKIAHSEKDRLPTPEFTTLWSDLEQALVRLGGTNIKTICDDMKHAVLSHDILLQVRQDISKFHEDLKLQGQQVEDLINKYAELASTSRAYEHRVDELASTSRAIELRVDELASNSRANELIVDELAFTSRGIKSKLEECSCSDYHKQEIVEWEQQDEIFVKTHVVDVILEKLQTTPCITITGKPGMGKSAIIHHIALLLNRNQGYTIVPCTNPTEIKTHYKKDHLQVFVFDDVCGRYSVSYYDAGEWIKNESNVIRILSGKKTKVLSSCRLQVFLEKQFPNINLFKGCNIDLTSEENSLTTQEKTQIALRYLDKDIVDKYEDILVKCEFLPLMCFLCKQNSPINVEDFLSNPFDIYTKELNLMEIQSDKTKWFALFLCVLHNGKIEETFFEQDHGPWRQEFQTILDHCGVNIGTSTMYIKGQLESLVGTYIKKTENTVEHDKTEKYDKVIFTIIHDKMFDFLCHYYGSNQQKIFIKHAKASVLGERTQLASLNENHDQFKVIITMSNETEFYKRSSEAWKNGDYVSVLNYDQMKFRKYRETFISYIKATDPFHLRMPCRDLESAIDIICEAGYYDMFCFLIEQKSDVNHNELLISACYGGNVDIVKDLINMGANVNYITFNIYISSPLVEACIRGHLPIVTFLIEKGADVNRTIEEDSPLSAACKGGHLPIVTLLINIGADVDETTDLSSPLISACEGGHLPIVILLIDKGADVNIKTRFFSPLITACEGGCLSIVTLLIDKGADVNQTTDLSSPLESACEGGRLPIVTLLFDKGANMNHPTGRFSPLISACKGGHLPIVTLLVDKGADIYQTRGWNSPLILACGGGHLSIVNFLIDKGADINQTAGWNSPLISACGGGHLSIVTLLIDKGADINQTANWNSPLSAACKSCHLPIVSLLIDKGADINQISDWTSPLISGCESGHLSIITLLIDKGADINQTAAWNSPLISACGGGHLSIVTLLIDKRADINQTANWNSPLISACEGGHLSVVTLLIDKGAGIDQSTQESSPLSAACYNGHLPIVTLLINKGANLNLKNSHGLTPLCHAKKSLPHNFEVVNLLVQKGAKL